MQTLLLVLILGMALSLVDTLAEEAVFVGTVGD
jgi:hypothetical protein